MQFPSEDVAFQRSVLILSIRRTKLFCCVNDSLRQVQFAGLDQKTPQRQSTKPRQSPASPVQPHQSPPLPSQQLQQPVEQATHLAPPHQQPPTGQQAFPESS